MGYRDGATAGQYDRGRDRRPDFENSDAYRYASHGYGGGPSTPATAGDPSGSPAVQ